MSITLSKTSRSLKNINVDGVLAGILLLVLLTMLVYWGYMKLQYSRFNDQIAEKQTELTTKKQELTKEKGNEGYLKYLAAKHVAGETQKVEREKNIRYLTSLLEELKAYNTKNKGSSVSNFQISETKISLQGQVGSLKDIYSEGGIIDQFSSYPFISHFSVPSYTKIEENGGYEFLLDADIIHHDGS